MCFTCLSYSMSCIKSPPLQYSKSSQRWFLVSYQLKNFKIWGWFRLLNILTSFNTLFRLALSVDFTATYSNDFFLRPLNTIILLCTLLNTFLFLFLHKCGNYSFPIYISVSNFIIFFNKISIFYLYKFYFYFPHKL